MEIGSALQLFTICLLVILATAQSCNEGELIREPYICEGYNQCENGIFVSKRCKTGQYFDGTKCDYIWKVDCFGNNCEDGKLYRKGDCLNEYGVCFRGKLYNTVCPTNQRFNGERCVTSGSCLFSKKQNDGNKLTADTIIKTNEMDDKAACTDGKATNHPSDCTMYELCVNGKWTDKSCPWLHHFDIKTHQCAYWDYTCSYGGPCVNEATESVYGRCSEYKKCVNYNWKVLTCEKGTYFQDGSCRKKSCPLRPVPFNCSYFMQPESDEIYQCPSQELFDNVEKQCVPKEDARCLEGECEDGDKTYVDSDCTKYKLCKTKTWVETPCPFLRHFDINTKECNFFSYTCGHDKPPPPTTTPKPGCTDGDKRGVQGDCKAYDECTNGDWKREACNVWGKFDSSTKECYYFELWKVHCT